MMLSEIKEIPFKAKVFLQNSPHYILPQGVPYIGMGSSYFAALSFKYMGVNIYPELASEFYNYLQKKDETTANAVLLSQSGKSTEVLWCADVLSAFTAITNDIQSPLGQHGSVTNIVDLLAGLEKYSSSKTYINTLLALFKGFGINVINAVELLCEKETEYEKKGKEIAESIFNLLQEKNISGLYITGSGPNIGTAMEAALIMSESTKLNFNGLPMPQYDHGPKETASNSIVIQITAKGKSYERNKKLADIIQAAGATVFTIEEPEATENESVIHNIVPFNYMAYWLSKKLNVKEMFFVGGKVTEVN